MRSIVKKTIGAILLGIVVAAGVVVWGRATTERDDTASEQTPHVFLEIRPWSSQQALPGDPSMGEEYYSIHCASCHGLRGDGQGTAAEVVWPPPRNHTDPGYMNLRTNTDLFTAIREGGTKVNRSRLMPPFNEKFDEVETWSLVAHIRTLHFTIEELIGLRPVEYGEVVLSAARGDALAKSLKERILAPDYKVVYYTFADGYVTFPTAAYDDFAIVLGLVFNKDFAIVKARTFRQIVLTREATPDRKSVDQFMGQFNGWTPRDVLMRAAKPIPEFTELSQAIASRIKKSLMQMELAIAQERDDAAEAKAIYEAFRKTPEKLPKGQRLYMENCMSCHGVLGRPLVSREDIKPRSLSDPEHMARLSDEYIKKLIVTGGKEMNISPAMPSAKLTEDELKELIAFLRSLAAIKPGGKCPCSILGKVCAMSHGPDGSCRCVQDLHGGGDCCPQIKK